MQHEPLELRNLKVNLVLYSFFRQQPIWRKNEMLYGVMLEDMLHVTNGVDYNHSDFAEGEVKRTVFYCKSKTPMRITIDEKTVLLNGETTLECDIYEEQTFPLDDGQTDMLTASCVKILKRTGKPAIAERRNFFYVFDDESGKIVLEETKIEQRAYALNGEEIPYVDIATADDKIYYGPNKEDWGSGGRSITPIK